MKHLTKILLEVDLHLGDKERDQALRDLNKYYTGREELLSHIIPPAALVDATHKLLAVHRRVFVVKIYPDGSIEL